MRKIERRPLSRAVERRLAERTSRIRRKRKVERRKEESEREWRLARQASEGLAVKQVLVAMNGEQHFCMYCEYNEAKDIDHFCPRALDPLRTFDWLNLLLACGNCNSNHKRNQFPPGLLNPTEPTFEAAMHFAFSPSTGELVPLTPEAQSSSPVFGLNRDFLTRRRVALFRSYLIHLVAYARHRDAGEADAAEQSRGAILDLPFRSLLIFLLRAPPERLRLLDLPEAVIQVVQRCPEIAEWLTTSG